MVFDHFVSNTALLHDGLMMEVAGAQCLLMAGFFADQMRQRHNIRWYIWALVSSPARRPASGPLRKHSFSTRSAGTSNRGVSGTRS